MNEQNTNAFPITQNTFTDFPEHIVALSHLRWDFVYQRPQHLLSRMAARTEVYFIEEPVFSADVLPHYRFEQKGENLIVAVPFLPEGTTPEQSTHLQKELLDVLTSEMDMHNTALWYYTPMALKFSNHLKPAITIFDCMDELSAFKFAPQELKDLEEELINKADIVFTGGASLYAAKQHRHHNIHLFASSIDRAHFGKARNLNADPEDQKNIPHPRLGFFGVIDERFDIDLINELSLQRPDWHFILVGPVVKIDPAALPQRANIHYTGSRSYTDLPAYLAGWDVAMIPFALNESTRFISPTKTPEYLAAGIPVISSPIRDVITPYGDNQLVHIAETPTEWIAAAEDIMCRKEDERSLWLADINAFLADNSWNKTCKAMQYQITQAMARQRIAHVSSVNQF